MSLSIGQQNVRAEHLRKEARIAYLVLLAAPRQLSRDYRLGPVSDVLVVERNPQNVVIEDFPGFGDRRENSEDFLPIEPRNPYLGSELHTLFLDTFGKGSEPVFGILAD